MDSCQSHELHPGLLLEAGAPVIPIEIQNLKGTIFLGLIRVISKDGDAADEGAGADGLDNEWILSMIA